MQVWVNGQLLERPDQPVLAVLDHGFTVGDGVFEAVKVVDGTPFALTRHLARLGRSARGLGLSDPDDAAVRRGVAAVLAAAPVALGRLRITWTAGPAPMGSGRAEAAAPTLVVAAAESTPYEPTTAVVTVPWPRNERGALAGVKTTSYAENVVALAEARRHGASEAIVGNTAGNLCEGTGSNVFYVVEGQVRTPSLASGCLAGITRELLLEWSDAVEIDEPMSVLERADEIFLVSTTRDVQPVARCDERKLVAPGPLTQRAMATWAEREPQDSDP
ncbi:MAG: aminotransferase class IV [Marmoricola sp.]